MDMVRFEWAQVVAFDGPAKPPLTPDDILDTPPAKLTLRLQPYLSLLELNFAVDDFLIAVKKGESDVLRGEASNAMNGAPKADGTPQTCSLSEAGESLSGRSSARQHALLQTPGARGVCDPAGALPRYHGRGCVCRSGHRKQENGSSTGRFKSRNGSMGGLRSAGSAANHERNFALYPSRLRADS